MESLPDSRVSDHAAPGRNAPANVSPEASREAERFFRCRRCGNCCRGEGGIVLGPADMARLRSRFRRNGAKFLAGRTETRRGKTVLKTGKDGFCIFFRQDSGCSIHPLRPDICRAWPFFRGNLVDRFSFFLAREDCPGIRRETAHHDFARAGFAYLRDLDLLARDPGKEGRALIVAERDLPFPGRVPA